MVEVYGKKARQINTQDPAHRHAFTLVNAQCKERRKEVGEEKKLPVPGRGFEHTTLTLEGKVPTSAPMLGQSKYNKEKYRETN